MPPHTIHTETPPQPNSCIGTEGCTWGWLAGGLCGIMSFAVGGSAPIFASLLISHCCAVANSSYNHPPVQNKRSCGRGACNIINHNHKQWYVADALLATKQILYGMSFFSQNTTPSRSTYSCHRRPSHDEYLSHYKARQVRVLYIVHFALDQAYTTNVKYVVSQPGPGKSPPIGLTFDVWLPLDCPSHWSFGCPFPSPIALCVRAAFAIDRNHTPQDILIFVEKIFK
jgi:hypothetical protein